mmetsp:Transcript_4626/g.5224  ORF Transcript_4626/g.5224 Transcript_4626/m.5224 type:complete len:681 (-) Transcript_4626:1379-3421(-)
MSSSPLKEPLLGAPEIKPNREFKKLIKSFSQDSIQSKRERLLHYAQLILIWLFYFMLFIECGSNSSECTSTSNNSASLQSARESLDSVHTNDWSDLIHMIPLEQSNGLNLGLSCGLFLVLLVELIYFKELTSGIYFCLPIATLFVAGYGYTVYKVVNLPFLSVLKPLAIMVDLEVRHLLATLKELGIKSFRLVLMGLLNLGFFSIIFLTIYTGSPNRYFNSLHGTAKTLIMTLGLFDFPNSVMVPTGTWIFGFILMLFYIFAAIGIIGSLYLAFFNRVYKQIWFRTSYGQWTHVIETRTENCCKIIREVIGDHKKIYKKDFLQLLGPREGNELEYQLLRKFPNTNEYILMEHLALICKVLIPLRQKQNKERSPQAINQTVVYLHFGNSVLFAAALLIPPQPNFDPFNYFCYFQFFFGSLLLIIELTQLFRGKQKGKVFSAVLEILLTCALIGLSYLYFVSKSNTWRSWITGLIVFRILFLISYFAVMKRFRTLYGALTQSLGTLTTIFTVTLMILGVFSEIGMIVYGGEIEEISDNPLTLYGFQNFSQSVLTMFVAIFDPFFNVQLFEDNHCTTYWVFMTCFYILVYPLCMLIFCLVFNIYNNISYDHLREKRQDRHRRFTQDLRKSREIEVKDKEKESWLSKHIVDEFMRIEEETVEDILQSRTKIWELLTWFQKRYKC